MRRAVVIPVYAEGNKGDEALAFMAGEFAKNVLGVDEVVFLAEGADCRGPWVNNGAQTGYRLVESLLKNPRRGIAARGRSIIDSRLNSALLCLVASRDLIALLWVLLWARYPSMAELAIPLSTRVGYRELLRCDVVVVKGGGFVHAYRGARWAYYLWYQLYLIGLAIRMGKPVIVLPNSYGPFEGRLSKYLARRVLSGCSLVSARESVSASVLGEVLGTHIRTYPDLAFGLKPSLSARGREHLLKLGVPIDSGRCVGLTVRPWRFPDVPHPGEAYRSYIRSLQRFVTYLAEEGYAPVFFQQVASPSVHEDDQRAIDDVTEGLAGVRFFVVGSSECSCSELMALYGHMRYVVGTRFHSVIFALAMGVPSLAITYGGNKGLGIMKDMGLLEYALPIEGLSVETLRERFDKLVKNESAIVAAVGRYLRSARIQWDELAREAFRAMSQHATNERYEKNVIP